jgi:methyl-accepting chemotaxis protein
MNNDEIVRNVTISHPGEVKDLLDSLNRYIQNIRRNMVKITENSISLTNTSKELSNMFSLIAEDSEQMNARSHDAAAIGKQASHNINTIVSNTDKMHLSMTFITKSLEQMDAALSKVAGKCQQESETALKANRFVHSTRELIEQLESSAGKIGKIVDVINNIAEQTNLLSLNATIEAASAGEAGKGFAVVANEVKSLAQQSAQATKEIEQRIGDMQNHTDSAIGAIKDITAIVEEVNAISQAIVSAVNEQSASARAIVAEVEDTEQASELINKNIRESAQGLTDVSSNINDISHSANRTLQSMEQAKTNAAKLADLANDLQKHINRFKISTSGKRIGDYLIEMNFITQQQLKNALASQKDEKYKGKRLGDILVMQQLLTREQFDMAVKRKMADEYNG